MFFNYKTTVLLIAVLFCLSFRISAQSFTDGLYMVQALSRTFDKARYLQEQSSYGFDDNICMLGAFVRKSESVKWSTTLRVGKKYVIVGGGDEDATDLDIIVRNSIGQIVVNDTQTDNNPIVQFDVNSTGKYTIELKLYGCSTNASYVSMAIMRDGANRIPKQNLSTILTNLYSIWNDVNTVYPLTFLPERNQWCVYGSVLEDGQKSTVTNVTMGRGTTVVCARSDSNAQDIDICLQNGSSQNLKCDASADDRPAVVYETTGYGTYGVETKNYESSGKRAFIMTSVLRVKQ